MIGRRVESRLDTSLFFDSLGSAPLLISTYAQAARDALCTQGSRDFGRIRAVIGPAAFTEAPPVTDRHDRRQFPCRIRSLSTRRCRTPEWMMRMQTRDSSLAWGVS